MTIKEDEEMERKRRQEDIDRDKREMRLLITIVGQGIGFLVMIGFYWAVLISVRDDVTDLVDTVNDVVVNQAESRPTVRRADKFMDEHTREHLKYWQNN